MSLIELNEDYLVGFKICLEAAAKSDPRYYLMGVFFEPSKNRMTGTDGHRLFSSAIVDEKQVDSLEGIDPVIISVINPTNNKPVTKLPKNWHYAIIDLEKKMIFGYASGSTPVLGTLSIEFVDGTFPSVQSVVDQTKKNKKDSDFYRIGFNPRLLSTLCDAAGVSQYSGMTKTYFTAENDVILFQFEFLSVTHFGMLMPARVSFSDINDAIAKLCY
jgi:hypothetical protein